MDSRGGHAQGRQRGQSRATSISLRIETNDSEDCAYHYSVAVPALAANSERTVLGYIVPGSDGAAFVVQVETTAGKTLQSQKVSRDPTKNEVLDQPDILFFAVGAGLSQLKRAAEELDKPKGKEA